MVNPGSCPDRGDIGWLTMDPQLGREQAGRRPVICLSPKNYNQKAGLALFCPVTSKQKGYPFEIAISIPKKISGVILSDQLKSLDWKQRGFELITQAPAADLTRATKNVLALISAPGIP